MLPFPAIPIANALTSQPVRGETFAPQALTLDEAVATLDSDFHTLLILEGAIALSTIHV
jgi:hypothetical protein